jgi:hypothetical protein
MDARVVQVPQTLVGLGTQSTFVGQRIVNVCEYKFNLFFVFKFSQ